ncbi:MAG: Lrp/AsnC family transcriptional regulator [Proteobacteria bacterium]|nr:Lrp/AsnC family transcriptional regulator [Pseudomonadota bacterium]
MLTELEKKVIASIQGDIPVSENPYRDMAEKIGVSVDDYLSVLQGLSDRGIIRRFGATLRHQKSGFTANAMVAWQVPEDDVEQVGDQMASFSEVSHCYRRNPAPGWPFNLYTMVHATSEDECLNIAKRISEKTSVETYSLLFSRRELKKTSMKYFSKE